MNMQVAQDNDFVNPFNKKTIILDHFHRFVFFHIPKVASSSIKNNLLTDLSKTKENIYSVVDGGEIPEFKDYYKFAFVRNPWDRLLSCYLDKIKQSRVTDDWFLEGVHRGFLKYKNLFNAGMSFENFVDVVCDMPIQESEEHFRPQYCFLTDAKGKLLTDFVGKFENIEHDYAKVARLVNINPVLSKINIGFKRKHYTEYYNPVCREKVAKKYKYDIDIFKYRFD